MKKILVAPYWNLNKEVYNWIPFRKKILVAPYWNLNKAVVTSIRPHLFILVAPYWNLNQIDSKRALPEMKHISSSILEFK